MKAKISAAKAKSHVIRAYFVVVGRHTNIYHGPLHFVLTIVDVVGEVTRGASQSEMVVKLFIEEDRFFRVCDRERFYCDFFALGDKIIGKTHIAVFHGLEVDEFICFKFAAVNVDFLFLAIDAH